jgi:hypothetical protein
MQHGTITNTEIELKEYFDFLKDNMVFKEMDILKDRVLIKFSYGKSEHHIVHYFNYKYLTVKFYIGIINKYTVMIKKEGNYNIRKIIFDYFLYREDIEF